MLRAMWSQELAKRRIGDVLDGRYELQGLLGVGMSGAVYQALHRYTQRGVAVKIMHPQLVSDPNAVARFLREAKAVGKIGHPSIVEILDAGETQDRWPYVVLELLNGRSLGKALEGGPLPFADVITVGIDLLDGLPTPQASSIATSSPTTCTCSSHRASRA
jgi:serine/threonine-protein kinase